MKEKIFESIFINIQNKNDIIKCGTIYRSPLNDSESNIKFRSHLDECLKNIKSCQKYFIFGDFNYDLAKTVQNSHVSDFTEIMLNYCLYSLINKSTRISQESATVLDHIWTNSYSLSINSGIILHPISDHMPVILSINTNESNKRVTGYKRSFNNKNINKFNQELEKIDISPIINEDKATVSYKIFIKNI